MHRCPAESVRRACRLFTLWTMMLAVPVYGCAGTLLQMLGPAHRHTGAAVVAQEKAALASFDRLAVRGLCWAVERWKTLKSQAHDPQAAGLFVHAPAQTTHMHAGYERHHHDAGQDGVIALGHEAADASLATELTAAAGSGSATLPLGLALSLVMLAPVARTCRWQVAPSTIWRNADRRRQERPPQG